jgi:hypothetical protein
MGQAQRTAKLTCGEKSEKSGGVSALSPDLGLTWTPFCFSPSTLATRLDLTGPLITGPRESDSHELRGKNGRQDELPLVRNVDV